MSEQSSAALGSRELSSVYGYELILDIHDCDTSTFNRGSIDDFFTQICVGINMEKCAVHFWDDVGVPQEEQQTDAHTKGTSAVCFILTSTIVVHTLDLLQAAYVNIFSCKEFDANEAERFTRGWFKGKTAHAKFIQRA